LLEGDRHEYKIKFLENGEIVRAKLGEPFPDEDQEVCGDRPNQCRAYPNHRDR
jgi:hypothetical protein